MFVGLKALECIHNYVFVVHRPQKRIHGPLVQFSGLMKLPKFLNSMPFMVFLRNGLKLLDKSFLVILIFCSFFEVAENLREEPAESLLAKLEALFRYEESLNPEFK